MNFDTQQLDVIYVYYGKVYKQHTTMFVKTQHTHTQTNAHLMIFAVAAINHTHNTNQTLNFGIISAEGPILAPEMLARS